MTNGSKIASKLAKHRGGSTLFGKPRSEVIKHPGSFRRAAHSHGESTHQYAEKEKGAGGKVGHRARLALAFETMRKRKAQ